MLLNLLTKNRLVMTTSKRAEVPRATRLSFWTPYAIAAPTVDAVKQAKQAVSEDASHDEQAELTLPT